MPIAVEVPVRIRSDSRALRERREAILDAVAAAAGRALDNSVDVVLKSRGGYVGVEVHAPEFVWSGDGLSEVQSALQVDFESEMNALLKQTIETAGVLGFA